MGPWSIRRGPEWKERRRNDYKYNHMWRQDSWQLNLRNNTVLSVTVTWSKWRLIISFCGHIEPRLVHTALEISSIPANNLAKTWKISKGPRTEPCGIPWYQLQHWDPATEDPRSTLFEALEKKIQLDTGLKLFTPGQDAVSKVETQPKQT